MYTRRLIVFIVVLTSFWSTQARGQDKELIDSLMNKLQVTSADTTLLQIYLHLGNEYVFNSPDTAAYYSKLALEIAEDLQDTLALGECYNYFGILGTIQGKYLTGIENFQLALEWYEKGDDLEGATMLINNIGVIYGYLENFTESIKHYKESYELSLQLEDSLGAALNLYNIAADYLEMENMDSLKYYTLLLEDFQKDRKPENTWSTASLWGEIYLDENKLDSAEASFQTFYDIMLEGQDHVQALSAQLGLAEVYLEQDRYEKALELLDKIETASISGEYNDYLLEILELRSKIFKELGEYDKAYTNKSDYISLKDSLDQINNLNRITELNAKYASEKKEKELAEMQAVIAEKEANKRAQDRIYLIIGSCALAFIIMMVISLIRKKKTNRILSSQNKEINTQRQKILSSINYAKKIQNSILTPEENIRQYLPDSFVYFKPKDIVSGDFYWFAHQDDKIIIATIDCTGHGVPGAFMSLIANSKLNKVVNEMKITEPSEILSEVHKEIVNSLNQASNNESAQDGMDMSLCVIDTKEKTIKYAGAQNPIFIVTDENVHEIKGDSLSIGGTVLSDKLKRSFQFTTKEVRYHHGSHLFMFTDGYIDQFGGKSNKKLNKSKFKELMKNLAAQNLQNAKSHVEEFLNNWKGQNAQVDDILIIGTRL